MLLNTHFKAIIFDCDGTLVDSEHAHFLSWKHALQKQGSDFSLDEYHPYIGKPTEEDAYLLAQKIGKDCAAELLQDKRVVYQKLQQGGLPAITPTVDFIRHLGQDRKSHNLKLAVASAAKKDDIMCNLKNLKIDHFFDVIISGQDDLHDYHDSEGTNKPKPYVYLHTAKLLGAFPQECIVIEDSYTGLTAGVSAGCFTVAIPNQYTTQHDFSKAHLKISSFKNMDVRSFLQMVERKCY